MPFETSQLSIDQDASRDSLSVRIYARLRLELMRGLHAPGARLNISKLAEALDTSVTPVREAVFQLIREGALELRTGHQPRVPVLGISTYVDIRETRIPLERLAGELATVSITDDEIEQLQAFHQQYFDGSVNGNWSAAITANQAFHFTIYRASRNDVLVQVIENLWLLIGPFVASQFPYYMRVPSEMHPHLMLIDALSRRSPSEVGELLVRDLREGSYRIISRLNDFERKPKTRK